MLEPLVNASRGLEREALGGEQANMRLSFPDIGVFKSGILHRVLLPILDLGQKLALGNPVHRRSRDSQPVGTLHPGVQDR